MRIQTVFLLLMLTSVTHGQAAEILPSVETITTHTSPEAIRGGGLIHTEHGTQARSVINRAFMDVQPPTATAFQLAAMLPGAAVATSDPFGLSPQTNISVRGLNGDALGYVLDGMPLNDIAYYGGYPSQFADTENYSTVALQQGSANLASPVLNAAGGLMTLHFRDPALHRGGLTSFSYGSHNTRRGFLRLETGEIGHTGIRSFVSYSNTYADNWRMAGHDTRQHIDAVLLKDWGSGNRIRLLGAWNRAITSYYPKVTRADWKAEGIHAKALKQHRDPANLQNDTDYWRLWRDPEETLYVGAPARFHLSRALSLELTPYAQRAYGNFPSGTTLNTTGNYLGTQPVGPLSLPNATDDSAVVRADYTQKSYRAGLSTALHVKTPVAHKGTNDIVIGIWYDYADDTEQQPFTGVSANGHAPDIWGTRNRDRILLPDGQRFLGGSFHTMSQVNALFIGDHLSLFHDRLALDAGFKEVMLSRWGSNNLPGPHYRVSSNSAEPLPRVGLRWSITPHDQLFLNATTNFRAPAVNAYYDTYSLTSPDLASTGNPHLKNEYSIAEEIGYRHTGTWLTGSLTFFNYNFTNRQVTTLVQQHGLNVSSTINAGGQTSRGVDAELGTRPLSLGRLWGGVQHLSPYASFEFLHATIDNTLPADGDILPTKGKTAVRSPSVQMAVGLRYTLDTRTGGQFYGMMTIHHTGRQYATFMNDEVMPAFTTADLTLGYRLGHTPYLQHPTLQLALLNLGNTHFLSGVSTTQFNAHTVRGLHGKLIPGQAPLYMIGGGFAALVTASTGF